LLVVALTGGIGCGKSAVSSHLESLGVPVIDADHLAHQLVKPGTPALAEIQTVFNEKVINTNGQLNRAELRRIVFSDPQKRKKLEGILHPRIRKLMKNWLKEQTAEYAVLVIPLLFETNQTSLAHRILVVDCDESIQIERVVTRDQLSTQQAKLIIDCQVNRQTRLQGADDIIENNGSLEKLIQSTDRLHQYYGKLAKKNA
jgi:dephospho-CoA kinase